MESGIYIITNTETGNRYIGQTRNFHKRFIQHRTKTHQARSVIGRAFRKHGKDAFEFAVLERCIVEDLDAREIHHIATLRPEYNMTPGGTGGKGKTFPLAARANLSIKGKEQWARMTPEQRVATVKRLQDNRKPWSAERREKTGADRRRYRQEHPDFMLKPVIRMDGSANNTAYFKSVNDAARATGIHSSAISRVIRGQRIRAGGHFWKHQRERDNQ
ncbi:MAG: GIY-YIG nuclease family protein [bacterium]